MTEGTVLHADLDAFYASVEQRDDPSLRGRPVIVGGGVVLAASYEAKARGVRTAMGGAQALRACPDAIVVPARFEAYTEASRAVFEVFHDTTPLVEGLSIDEAFLEVGGLRRIRGLPSTIATQLRVDVRERVGLPISVGVARTKYLAKVASAVSKPEGMLVVPVEGELEFLHALPVERLWGVGKVTSGKLRDARIRTVGDVAEMFESELVQLLGSGAGRHLYALAHNRDPRPVQTEKRRGSMGAQHAMGRGAHSPAELDLTLLSLVDRVTRRMRAAGRTGSTVTISLRFGDFTRSTSSHTLSRPTAHTVTVLDVARRLLASRAGVVEQKGITLLGVSLGSLDDQPAQLALPLDVTSGAELDDVIDAVRNKFGGKAVRRAVQLGSTDHLAAPHLPD
ncbi:DNA polymerase IV [Aeromicrobium fastidiosum]|uniref:DNA polymerase IV n=1 Tax=Aeromicrobium fastidiosum TaxID=52699 RepID=A0A641AN11_9ACTN|nr:DNA polymerase IV [Aeromicrobium fastidiosum]KAA1378513.1 DNA polymerase IV [Aeromicrobium fastidiosum]MBP2392519.1 DNA polymerase-4 [Aeromicrobium fastidiosum]